MEYWREEALKHEKLTENGKRILRNGPKSLSEAWLIAAMKRKYQTPGSTE